MVIDFDEVQVNSGAIYRSSVNGHTKTAKLAKLCLWICNLKKLSWKHMLLLCLHVNIYGTKITQHGKVCSTSREKKWENMATVYTLFTYLFLFSLYKNLIMYLFKNFKVLTVLLKYFKVYMPQNVLKPQWLHDHCNRLYMYPHSIMYLYILTLMNNSIYFLLV